MAEQRFLWRWLERPRIFVSLIVVVCVAGFGGVLAYRVWRVPHVPEPFDVEAFLDFEIPDEENAFTHYRLASYRYRPESVPTNGEAEQEARQLAMSNSIDRTLEDGWEHANDDVRHWLEANREALEIWKEGTRCEDGYERHPNSIGVQAPSSTILASPDFARLVGLEALRLTSEGDTQAAIQWYLAAFRYAWHMETRGASIHRLVGIAIHAITTEGILHWAQQPEVTRADLKKVLDELKVLHAATPPLSESLKLDYLDNREAIESLFKALGAEETIYRILGEDRLTQRILRAVYANWIAFADLPRYERPAKLSDGQFGLYKLPEGNRDDPRLYDPTVIESWGGSSYFGAGVLANLADAVDEYDSAVTRGQARQHALELALALQIHYREHGEFPETLEPLVGEFFEQIPADPFGQGEPMRYRHESQEGESIVIWTVRSDGVDQNGETEPNSLDAAGDWAYRVRPPK